MAAFRHSNSSAPVCYPAQLLPLCIGLTRTQENDSSPSLPGLTGKTCAAGRTSSLTVPRASSNSRGNAPQERPREASTKQGSAEPVLGSRHAKNSSCGTLRNRPPQLHTQPVTTQKDEHQGSTRQRGPNHRAWRRHLPSPEQTVMANTHTGPDKHTVHVHARGTVGSPVPCVQPLKGHRSPLRSCFVHPGPVTKNPTFKTSSAYTGEKGVHDNGPHAHQG